MCAASFCSVAQEAPVGTTFGHRESVYPARTSYALGMTLEMLERQVADALATAESHAARCRELLASDNLSGALDYCRSARIRPPACSLTARSHNADRLRESACGKLSDVDWWRKGLEAQAVRDFEADQFARGNVRNYVSDAVLQFHEKKRRSR